jgi:TolA-binding protein
MPGPIIRSYKAGSIVYFEKDKADDIYVLQSGRIILSYTQVDTKVEVKEDVKLGEFFGVKSALGRYPREETAQVVGGANVLVFKLADFEVFVATKTHLILKMMKVFSSQLRQIHGKVREQLGQYGDQKSPAYELMNVAEVFHKSGNFDHAVYAYQKYLINNPTGNYANRAKDLLASAQKNSMYPMIMSDLVYEPEMKSAPNKPSFNVPPSSSSVINDTFSKSMALFNSNDYQTSVEAFRAISNATPTTELEISNVEKANFYLAMCQFLLNQLDPSYSSFSTYVKKYPKGEKVKESIHLLGRISEKKGERDKAMMLYKKVLTLLPDDEFTEKAKSDLTRLGA